MRGDEQGRQVQSLPGWLAGQSLIHAANTYFLSSWPGTVQGSGKGNGLQLPAALAPAGGQYQEQNWPGGRLAPALEGEPTDSSEDGNSNPQAALLGPGLGTGLGIPCGWEEEHQQNTTCISPVQTGGAEELLSAPEWRCLGW